MAAVTHIIQKFVPVVLPPADAFSGQTTIVTGGTSGLGIAAAVHFLNLGAKEVIITARKASSPRAEEAKRKILEQVAGKSKKKNSSSNAAAAAAGGGQVTIMDLDMNSFDSCVAFVEALKTRYSAEGVDAAVLNAGSMNTEFVKSLEGWEETIQVNAISTTLLAVLLLPLLKEQQRRKGKPSHLVFVGSGTHIDVDIKQWPSYVTQDGGIMAHYAKKENYPPGVLDVKMYGISKLLLHYTAEDVSKLALGSNGEPQVIVTTVCPGPVATDLARNISSSSVVARVLISLFFMAQTKSPDYGARIYINAAVAGPEKHGKFLLDYMSDKQYASKSKFMISSPQARKMQAEVWREMKEILLAKVPAVRETLQQ